MRKIIILLFVFIPLINFAHSGDTIIVQNGTTPTIDGVLSVGEWSDAVVVTINLAGGATGTCYVKHNGVDKLYIAQETPPFSGYSDHSFLWFDTENNGGSAPQTDDYWLSTYSYYIDDAYEFSGTGSAWNTGSAMSGWSRACTWNETTGQQYTEYEIPFSKLGIDQGVINVLGFMIACGDNPEQADYWHWPNTVINDYKIPNNWADMIISFPTRVNEKHKQVNNVSIYPNPSNGKFIIKGENLKSIELINEIGQIVYSQLVLENNYQNFIDISNLPNGMFFVKISINEKLIMKKLIINNAN